MQNVRTYYFPANDCRVVTGLCPNGEYGAYREDEDEGRVRGFGHSRLAAIADLVEREERSETVCDKCSGPCSAREENDYGEIVCDDCEQNAAEAAYERFCEAFHDGGDTSFKSLQQQQIEARRLK